MNNFLDKEYNECNLKRSDVDDQNIWILWFQGEDNMPDIIRICYKQLLKQSNGHKVILLTKDNLENYLRIPNIIKNRLGKTISYAAYSDYIRLNLLSIYGGLWIDSTYLVTRPLPEEIFIESLWTVKKKKPTTKELRYSFVSKSRWAGNLMSCKCNQEQIKKVRNLFCNYLITYPYLFDYLFIDYCFAYLFYNDKVFRKIIENIPYSNPHSLDVAYNFNKEWDFVEWTEWNSTTTFFKLSYKGEFTEKINNKITYYGYLKELYSTK